MGGGTPWKCAVLNVKSASKRLQGSFAWEHSLGILRLATFVFLHFQSYPSVNQFMLSHF